MSKLSARSIAYSVGAIAYFVLVINDLQSTNKLATAVHATGTVAFVMLALDGDKASRPKLFRLITGLAVLSFGAAVVLKTWPSA
jgi:hypothetical protein